MKTQFFLLLFFFGCTLPPTGTETLVKLSPTKQKQKIDALQKKLDLAEKERQKIGEEVDYLREEIMQRELALVRRVVSEMEVEIRKWEKNPMTETEIAGLFLKERETLHRIIQAGPTPSSSEAQVILDQILRMITNLNEQQKAAQ